MAFFLTLMVERMAFGGCLSYQRPRVICAMRRQEPFQVRLTVLDDGERLSMLAELQNK